MTLGQTDGGERSVELYVRSLSPSGTHRQQDRVVRRLDELLGAGAVDDYDVRVWGDRIRRASPCARTADGRHVRDRLARIRRWADERGYSLEGVYREVDRHSTVTDESWTEIKFPQVALAEFVGGDLARFTPVRDVETGRIVRVADHLDHLDYLSGADTDGETGTDDGGPEGEDGGTATDAFGGTGVEPRPAGH